MKLVTVSGSIPAPLGVVWKIVTDIDNFPNVFSAIERVEKMKEAHPESRVMEEEVKEEEDTSHFFVGTQWRETRKLHEREHTVVLRVTSMVCDMNAARPWRCYTTESEAEGGHYTSKVRVESEPDRKTCSFSIEFTLRPRNIQSRIMNVVLLPLSKGMITAMCEVDIAEIAEAAKETTEKVLLHSLLDDWEMDHRLMKKDEDDERSNLRKLSSIHKSKKQVVVGDLKSILL